MNDKNKPTYLGLLRFMAFLTVVFLWMLSIRWSAEGFSVKRPDLQWIGVGLAISVTVAQLIFNRGSINPTLFVVGLAAYVYGIGTNIAGINQALRIDLSVNAWKLDPFSAAFDMMILGGLSIVIEIFPESLLLWVIYPELKSPGDFVSTLIKGTKITPKTVPSKYKSGHISENRQKSFPYKVDWNKLDKEDFDYKILQFYRRYWYQKGQDASNEIVAQETSIPAGRVAKTLQKMKSGGFS